MVAHTNTKRGPKRCRTPPNRRSAAPRGIKIAYVNRPFNHQVAHPVQSKFALPGSDGQPCRLAHIAQPPPVVVPAYRLLEPAQRNALRFSKFGEADSIMQGVALVGIDHKSEVWPGYLSRNF